MLFIRGDGVFEKSVACLDEEIFGLSKVPGLYTSQYSHLCFATGLRTFRDSIRLCGHEKNVAVLSNN